MPATIIQFVIIAISAVPDFLYDPKKENYVIERLRKK